MKSETLPRKLAAILYADVAGYSRLTADDEDATHRILRLYLDSISATVDRHGGRVMHYAGDAVLAMFGAVLDALKCATEIQRDLATRNAELPSDRRVQFRIGVNLGDVIEDRGDIYGDGVNVAARLEGLAEPGGICVSESVRAAVGKRPPLQFDDLGERVLKNIEHPVRAYRVRLGDASHAATGHASLDGPTRADAREAGRRPGGALGRLRSLAAPFAASAGPAARA
ncbi:MAG TPA: adenylate/guanylate cyclase domain-containing protein [Gammaproteobacteria bacterium]